MEAPPPRTPATPVRSEGDYDYFQVASDPKTPITFKMRRGTPTSVKRAAIDAIVKAEQEFDSAVAGLIPLDEAKRRVIRMKRETEQNGPEEVARALDSVTMAMVSSAEARFARKQSPDKKESVAERAERELEEETARDFGDTIWYKNRQKQKQAEQELSYLETKPSASPTLPQTLPMFDVDDRRYLTEARNAFRSAIRDASREALTDNDSLTAYLKNVMTAPVHRRGDEAAERLSPYLAKMAADVIREEKPDAADSEENRAEYRQIDDRVGDLKLYWPEEFARDEARSEEQDDNQLLQQQRYFENYDDNQVLKDGALNQPPSGRYVRTPGSRPGQPAKRSPVAMQEEAARQVAARQNLLASASAASQRAGRLQVDTAVTENTRNARAGETEGIRQQAMNNEHLRREQEARSKRRAFILASAEAFDTPVTEADLMGLSEAEELQLAKDMYKAIGGKGTAGFLRKARAPNQPKTVYVEAKVTEARAPATKRARGRPKKATVKAVAKVRQVLKPSVVIIKREAKPKRAAKKKAAPKKKKSGKGKGGKKGGKKAYKKKCVK